MIREELEFRIARYADGDLTEAERVAVESELAADADARALLAEYQTLRTAIEEAAGPALPKVHWDRLEQLLCSAVAKAAPESSVESEERDGPFVGALGVEDEFAIACHADGTLPAERRVEVEQLLGSDPRAQALLNEYHNLDAATKAVAYSDAAPTIRWDRLARHIGGVVDSGASASLPEEIERQIDAFAQGALPDDDCDALEARLAVDSIARVRASEYRNLDAAIQAMGLADPVPPVEWERFAGRISAALDREVVRLAVGSRQSEDRYSILSWLRSPTRMALAASVLISVALIARVMHGGGPGVHPGHPIVEASKPAVEEIAALQPEAAAGALQSEISIGPPAEARAESDEADTGDDGVVSRPPRAFVASGRGMPSEAEALPAMPF